MTSTRAKRFAPLLTAGCVIGLALAVWLCAGPGAPARAAADPGAKLSPALAAALAQGETPLLVYFAGQPDLSGASAYRDGARKRYVYDLLRAQAARSQEPARALLERAGSPVRQYYLLNMLETRANAALAQSLAALPEVTRLGPITVFRAHLPLPLPTADDPPPQAVATVEWGVQRIQAPDVWSTYGVRGEGIVIGIADTGVQWDHPALKAHYRGWNGVTVTHTLNWHDAVHATDMPPPISDCGSDVLVPCDDYGHGTHVTGIAVGDDGGTNQIGVAPGAKWIACHNMDQGNGTIARYTECFQFMLAPYPQNGNPLSDGRPELAANIVNNSWTCTSSEGCDSAHLNDLRTVVQNAEAAGILVVAAAGNSGPACATVSEPISIYAETLTVGATDSSDGIASFSSRGPVSSDGSGRRKPDISAPGVYVRSSRPISRYDALSGTSMASPHIAGAAALLWSAVPGLSGNISASTALLQASANHRVTTQNCGDDGAGAVPNNVFGHGIVNAFAAIRLTSNRLYIPILISP